MKPRQEQTADTNSAWNSPDVNADGSVDRSSAPDPGDNRRAWYKRLPRSLYYSLYVGLLDVRGLVLTAIRAAGLALAAIAAYNFLGAPVTGYDPLLIGYRELAITYVFAGQEHPYLPDILALVVGAIVVWFT